MVAANDSGGNPCVVCRKYLDRFGATEIETRGTDARRRATYRVYWANQPAPAHIKREHLDRLVPAEFSSEDAAFHAAALILRAREHVWRIERPNGSAIDGEEVAAKVAPILALSASPHPRQE